MAESGNDNKNNSILSNIMSQHINFKSNKSTKKSFFNNFQVSTMSPRARKIILEKKIKKENPDRLIWK